MVSVAPIPVSGLIWGYNGVIVTRGAAEADTGGIEAPESLLIGAL